MAEQSPYYGIIKNILGNTPLTSEQVVFLSDQQPDDYPLYESALSQGGFNIYGFQLATVSGASTGNVWQGNSAWRLIVSSAGLSIVKGSAVGPKNIKYGSYSLYKSNYDPAEPDTDDPLYADYQKIQTQINDIKKQFNKVATNLKLVSYEDWKKIIIKTFPNFAQPSGNVLNSTGWSLTATADDTNPDGLSLEEQKTNILSKAESNKPDDLKSYYVEYTQKILS